MTQPKSPSAIGQDAVTVVADVGARYGVHPSWAGFDGDVLYFAFEPDQLEADRLRKRATRAGYEVVETALGNKHEERNLYITRHRGYCSFREPDLESFWFKYYRPGEGEVEAVQRVKTVTLDHFVASRQVRVDFLKIDTEGSELEVLEGAEQQLSASILGLRTEACFQSCYKEQPLFPEIHNYLLKHRFFLLNLDYFGRGVPYNGLFRKPDPLAPDNDRYGTLIGTDGVWLRDYRWVCERYAGDQDRIAYATLKYAYFCILNNGPDVGVGTLHRFVKHVGGKFGPSVQATSLYCGLRRTCASYLGRWRVFPDAQWDLARSMFKDIFDIELESGHRFWEQYQNL